MLPAQQFLGELVAALVRIPARAGKEVVDPRLRRIAKVIRGRQNFIGGFAVIDLVLGEGAGRSDCEKLGRNSDKARKQKLLAIEFRAKARHRMKQSARESFARSRGIIHVSSQIAMETVNLAGTGREPLARIPSGVKFPRREHGFQSLGHWQSRVENRTADFQMWVERFAGDKKPHDFARAFENHINPTIAQETFDRDSFFAATFERL